MPFACAAGCRTISDPTPGRHVQILSPMMSVQNLAAGAADPRPALHTEGDAVGDLIERRMGFDESRPPVPRFPDRCPSSCRRPPNAFVVLQPSLHSTACSFKLIRRLKFSKSFHGFGRPS